MNNSISYTILSASSVRDLMKEFHRNSSYIKSAWKDYMNSYSITEMKRFCYSDSKQQYKTNYSEIFKDKYRLYIQPKLIQNSQTQDKISDFLSLSGYKIDDYSRGLAQNSNDPARKRKISRLLKKSPELLNEFCNDQTRCVDDMVIVLSKHPIDIAKMSTSRPWSSACTAKGKDHFNTIHQDLKKGSLIAYETTLSDPNIKFPRGRIMIRPFKNDKNERLLVPLIAKKYGSDNIIFRETVVNFVENNINKTKAGIFKPEIPDLSEGIDQITRPHGKPLSYTSLLEQQPKSTINLAIAVV